MTTTPMRILIVDDCQDTARMMKVLLKGGGHETKLAYDGAEALRLAHSYRPDVILLDLVLPDMSGADVAEELRSIDGSEATAIIAVSGYGSEGLSAAFDTNFLKPLDHDALLGYLARWQASPGRTRHPAALGA